MDERFKQLKEEIKEMKKKKVEIAHKKFNSTYENLSAKLMNVALEHTKKITDIRDTNIDAIDKLLEEVELTK